MDKAAGSGSNKGDVKVYESAFKPKSQGKFQRVSALNDNQIINESLTVMAIENKETDLPIDKIKPSPYQPRMNFNEKKLLEMANTIKAKGLVHSIVVRPVENGYYELVAGERRLRAAKLAGWKTIPASIKNMPDEDVAYKGFIENYNREPLTEIEQYMCIVAMIRKLGKTQNEIADEIGLTKARVSQILSVGKLPEDVVERLLLVDDIINQKHIRALIKLKKTDQRFVYALLQDIEQYHISGDEALKRMDEMVQESETKTPIDPLFNKILSGQEKIKKQYLKADDKSKEATVRKIDQLINVLQTLKNSLL